MRRRTVAAMIENQCVLAQTRDQNQNTNII